MFIFGVLIVDGSRDKFSFFQFVSNTGLISQHEKFLIGFETIGVKSWRQTVDLSKSAESDSEFWKIHPKIDCLDFEVKTISCETSLAAKQFSDTNELVRFRYLLHSSQVFLIPTSHLKNALAYSCLARISSQLNCQTGLPTFKESF